MTWVMANTIAAHTRCTYTRGRVTTYCVTPLSTSYRDESLGLVDHEADLADGLEPPPYTSAALPAAASTDQLLSEGRKNTGFVSLLLNLGKQKSPSHQSAQLVNYVTVVYGTSARQFRVMWDG